MILIDTSVVIQLLRDRSGVAQKSWRKLVARHEIVLSRFTQLELLQGAKTEAEWAELESYLDGQDYLDPRDQSWRDGARLFFELRGKGVTIRSVIDCLIAQLAIESKLTLVHNDRDYEWIYRFRPSLRQRRVDLLA